MLIDPEFNILNYRLFGKKGFGVGALALAPYPVALGMQVFFANQLSVEEVGVFAKIGLFLSLLLALSNWNGDKYIISKQNISREQIDEVFTFEIFSSLVLYLIMVIFLRDVGNSYLGVQNSSLFWVAIGFICCYYPLTRSKAILEKRLSYVPAYSPIFFANIIAGIIGGICVFQGFGLWSMVVWKISIHLIEVTILLFLTPYIPRLRIGFLHTSDFLSYCLPIFLGGVISFLGTNVDYILVTSLMGERELGIYWLAFSVSHIPIIFRELIARLLLPILSKQSSDERKLLIFGKLNGTLQILGVVSAIVVTYWSDRFFIFAFGEKWSDAVPVFIVLYYAALYKLVGGSIAPLLFSVMKTKVAFNVAVINLFIFIPIIFLAIKFGGLTGAATGVLISSILLIIIVFETSVRNFCKEGFLYYLSYMSVNIASLYIISAFLIDDSDGTVFRILATCASLAFAVITLPINAVLKRAFRHISLTKSMV